MILYLFDLDGTLLHAHGAGRAAFDAVLRAKFQLAAASTGVQYGGKTDPQILDEILVARRGRVATADERAEFLRAYVPELAARLAADGARAQACDGAHEALAYLAARRDVCVGVATGNIREGAAAKLAAAGLASWFPAGAVGGYGCDSHVRAELVAAAVARGKQRVGGDVREVIVVGDTIHDIAAARANGATAVAVTTGGESAEQLAGADVVMASLRELPAWHAARFSESAAPTARPAR